MACGFCKSNRHETARCLSSGWHRAPPVIQQLTFLDLLDEQMAKPSNVNRLDSIIDEMKLWNGGRLFRWRDEWDHFV